MSYVGNTRFLGNKRVAISAIAGAIEMSRTSGSTPCFVQASASGITATGTSLPYEHLEFRWDFGDPTGTETFTLPTTGQVRNANVQYGPEAAYVYRSAGTYTVTLRARGVTAGGSLITATFTTTVTVTAFSASGGDYYFDSVAGNDANDGLSSGAPKQTMAALTALLASNRRFNLKRGSTFAGTDGIAFPTTAIASLRIVPYGSGADPVIQVTSGANSCLSGNNGTTGAAGSKTDIVVSSIVMRQDTGNGVLSLNATSNATGQVNDVYLDRCTMTGTAGSGMTVCKISFEKDTPTVMSRVGLWGCGIYNTETASLGSKHGFFGGSHEWFFTMGCNFAGGGTSTTLDHHMYLEVRNHALYAWNGFGNGPGRNYALNINIHYVGGASGEALAAAVVYGQYHNIRENSFNGTLRGCDASETHLTITECRFKNFVNEGNIYNGVTGDGVILFYSAETMTVRRNKVWNCEGGRWFAPQSTMATILLSCVYENQFYYATVVLAKHPILYDVAYTFAQQITDNVFVDLRTDARAIRVSFTGSVAAGDVIDYNQVYCPNDTTFMGDGGTQKTWAQWIANGFDAHGTNTDPGWINPSTGIFDLPAARTKMGMSST